MSKAIEPVSKPVLVEEKERPKYLELPLGLPPLVMRGVGYPFKAFANWAEKVDLFHRAHDFFSNDEQTAFFYPILRLGGDGGIRGGLGASHRNFLGHGLNASSSFLISPGLDQDVTMSLSDPEMGHTGLSMGFVSTWRRRHEDNFYGIGNNSPDDDFPYESRLVIARIPFAGKWGSGGRWSLFGGFLGVDTLESDEPNQGLRSNFPVSALSGFDQWNYGAEFGGSVGFSNVEKGGVPGNGFKTSLQFSRFEGAKDYSFFRTNFSLARYFTLFKPGRVIVLGSRFESVHTLPGESVPFSLLPSLGGTAHLRGFPTFRFRDRTSLLAILEYRYPIWRMADGMFFVEGGRVGNQVQDLSVPGFHPSGGFGVRFRTEKLFFFQLLAAFSEDGPRFVFSVNQAL